MADETYKEAFSSALKELESLMTLRESLDSKREVLDQKIFKLREGLFGLAILCGTDTNAMAERRPDLFPDLISPDVGLSDAVRKALSSKQTYVSPPELRDRLKEMGFETSNYRNILATIHSVLKRLVENEEVDTGNRDGRVVYRWRPAIRVPAQSRSTSS